MLAGLLHTAIRRPVKPARLPDKKNPPEAIRQGQDLVVAGRKSVRHGRGRVRQIVDVLHQRLDVHLAERADRAQDMHL
jgi:hypothetical protein